MFPLFLAPHLAVLATAGAAVADGDEKAARAAEKAARAAKLAQAMAVVTFTKKIDQVLRCAQIYCSFYNVQGHFDNSFGPCHVTHTLFKKLRHTSCHSLNDAHHVTQIPGSCHTLE